MRKKFAQSLGLLVGLAGLVAPEALMAQPALPAGGPSFDCSKPSELEAAICGDPTLSASDRRVAAFYESAKPGALDEGSNQLGAQRAWLKERDKACAKGAWKTIGQKSLVTCLAAEYDGRLQDLAVATLMVSPTDSLAEIRRIQPAAAPIYQALFTYVSTIDPEQRAAAVEPLLTPIYAAMDAQGPPNFPPDIKAATPHDAVSSDSSFARFFDVASVFGNAQLTWPCAALLTRPGLIDALGSIWGGSIDGQIPASDCQAAMPPLPEVDSLSQDADDAQPQCDGTIRFSAGREEAKLEDAVRLHRPAIWQTTTAPADPPSAGERAFRRKNASEIAKASTALAAYYVKYFKVPQPKADHDASTATAALVEAAFNSCD